MKKSNTRSRRHTFIGAAALLAGAALAPVANAAASKPIDYYDAALCKPPMTIDWGFKVYDAVQKLGEPQKPALNAAVYKAPKPIGKDGFESKEIVLTSDAIGVLVEGAKAEALASRYRLSLEKPDPLLRANITKSYARKLDHQPSPELGTVYIIARESPLFPGKTWLACQLLSRSDEERAAAMRGTRDQK